MMDVPPMPSLPKHGPSDCPGSPLGAPDTSDGPPWSSIYVNPSYEASPRPGENLVVLPPAATGEHRIDLILARLAEPQATALMAIAAWRLSALGTEPAFPPGLCSLCAHPWDDHRQLNTGRVGGCLACRHTKGPCRV